MVYLHTVYGEVWQFLTSSNFTLVFFRNQSYWQSCRARLDGSTEYHIGGGGTWLMADCQNIIDGKLPETNYGSIRFVVRWSWWIYVPFRGNYHVIVGFRMGVSLTNFQGLPRRIVWATYRDKGGVCDSRRNRLPASPSRHAVVMQTQYKIWTLIEFERLQLECWNFQGL